MKRKGYLFDQIFSEENLYLAYLDARKGKRKKRACFEFETNLGANLASLYGELQNNAYEPKPYFKFIIHEPKERTIYAPAFRDVVVQHAIYRIIYNVFNRTFISTSFACRIGYGTHRASDYTQKALRSYEKNLYTLKLDIRKFFYSINRDILRLFIERKIKDKRLVDVMMLFTKKEGLLGIPIGNLLSQIYALIYLNPLDHFIKRILKIKHYVRYVDDFILIGLTRDKCLECRVRIIEFLREKLQLELSRSTIQKIKRGVNFVGYRTWQNRRLIRKYSLYKFKRVVKKGKRDSIVSLLGHTKKTNSLLYMLQIIKESPNDKDIQIPKSCRRIYNLHSSKI
jgi:retron-type reverse transcriptase